VLLTVLIYLLIDLSLSNKNKFQNFRFKISTFSFPQILSAYQSFSPYFTLSFEKRQEIFSATNKEKQETTNYGVLVVTSFNSSENYKRLGRPAARIF